MWCRWGIFTARNYQLDNCSEVRLANYHYQTLRVILHKLSTILIQSFHDKFSYNLQKKAVTHIYHATPYPVNEKAPMYAGNWCKLNDYFHFPFLKSIDRGTTIILSISISSSLLRTSQLKYITVMIIPLYCFVAKCFMDIDHVWCEMSDSFVLLKRISFNKNHEFGSR